jgi:hypothetical protein
LFDLPVGDWDVCPSVGDTPIAHSRIESPHGGCAARETTLTGPDARAPGAPADQTLMRQGRCTFICRPREPAGERAGYRPASGSLTSALMLALSIFTLSPFLVT